MLRICRICTLICWKYAENMQNKCWKYAENMLEYAEYAEYAENMLKIYRKCAKNMQNNMLEYAELEYAN